MKDEKKKFSTDPVSEKQLVFLDTPLIQVT